MASLSYKASGKYTLGGVLLFLLGGIVGGFFIGAAYIYLLGLVANVMLRCLVVIGFLFAVSGWLVLLVRKTKIRNTRVVIMISILILLLTYYNSWVFYVHLVYDSWLKGANEVWAYHFQFPLLLQRWWELFSNPGNLISAAAQILPVGFVSINGQLLKGIPLLFVWFSEFAVLFIVPLYNVAYRAGRPYDEEKKIWLPVKEEWTIRYLDGYREIRNGIRRKDLMPLINSLDQIEFYQMQGQESYAIIEFCRNRKEIGRYISITNVKAIQAGPRKLKHRAIAVCKMIDVGAEAAAEIYERVKKGFEESEKCRPKFKLTSKQAWEDKLSALSFNLSRKTKIVTSEIKNSTKAKNYRKHPMKTELEMSNTEELPAVIEEITVHVPRVTPEMEKEYLNRRNPVEKN